MMKESIKQSECELRCKYCGCDTREDVIYAAFWVDNRLIVIEGIPAHLCEGCGEQFLDERITQAIQKLLKNPGADPERKVRISVYDLPQLESIEKRRRFQSIKVNKESQVSLQCKYCKSETVEELVKSAFWVNEQLIAVENIPARVCLECKVQFYDDETAESIATLEKLRSVPNRAKRDAMASIFSLVEKKIAANDKPYQDAIDHMGE